MPRIFQHEFCVRPDEIDGQGHANNVAYFQWMQNAATAHSAAQGWGGRDYAREGWSWVVRTHFIEYRSPAFDGDPLVLRTWVADMKGFTSLRKYAITRGETLLARAETNWAFVNVQTGRLMKIPEQVKAAFELVDDPPDRRSGSPPESA